MRVDYTKELPKGFEAMLALEGAVTGSGLEPLLLELVKLRASQINGCAYCMDMHGKDARARGEDEQRLHVLAGWREAPFYNARERAALAWCEALTLLPDTGAPDGVFAEVKQQFSDEDPRADLPDRGDQRLAPASPGAAHTSRRLRLAVPRARRKRCLTPRSARVGEQSGGLAGLRLWLLRNPSGIQAHHQLDELVEQLRALRWTIAGPR